ncbi:hypothetical protein L1987_44567 [Smallanthus sonchifolius]|uniref:Uncharacterized protein n=1 Tax=Smallanthus sonchifolius TaxID=185202 RepID=A0ACB9GPS4_9ASTR|nr:hypothetical protein L1987_44567 [Smallanthus sonchifolius]
MEASIMDGPGRRCGAVSGVSTVKNPVSLARLVMDKSPHSYLAFSGAEDFAKQMVSILLSHLLVFHTTNSTIYILIIESQPPDTNHVGPGWRRMNGLPISVYAPETVGCVVVDSQGRCVVATSTGGLMDKRTGRIGDSPLIGAGTYACDACGVSCTGEGEAII